MESEESSTIPSPVEKQSQGCLANGLRFGFWSWAAVYGYFALVMLFAYATRPIVGDDFMDDFGILVALAAIPLVGVGVALGNLRWHTIPLAVLIAVNTIGPVSMMLLFLSG
jgi:hypothetical protein